MDFHILVSSPTMPDFRTPPIISALPHFNVNPAQLVEPVCTQVPGTPSATPHPSPHSLVGLSVNPGPHLPSAKILLRGSARTPYHRCFRSNCAPTDPALIRGYKSPPACAVFRVESSSLPPYGAPLQGSLHLLLRPFRNKVFLTVTYTWNVWPQG